MFAAIAPLAAALGVPIPGKHESPHLSNPSTGVPAVLRNFLQTITTDALDEIYGADGVLVEDDLQDINRVNIKVPVDVVNGLHVVAGVIDLIL